MEPRIRFAEPTDADLIEQIENEADRLLTDRLDPEQWLTAPSGNDRLAQPGFLLVIEVQNGDIAGFTHVLEVDTACHLEQLSIRPEHSRRGLGRGLLDAAKEHAQERGYKQISLRTYADVPLERSVLRTGWLRGRRSGDGLPQVARRRRGSARFDRYGRRVQMVAELEIRRP